MAIEKVRKKKLEISTKSLTELIISSVLVVTSLVLGYVSFSKWRFKENLLSAYRSLDTNQPANAKAEIEGALRWRSDHRGAREFHAKLLCDAGQLPEAEAEYRRLLGEGFGEPPVHVGLGVVYLKLADKATTPAEVGDRIKQAQAEFKEADPIRVPEGAIGLAHCELLLAGQPLPAGGPKHYDQARAIFDRIGKDFSKNPEYRKSCTREGLVDYHAGLGKALATTGKYDPAAAAAFRACWQYVRRWRLPMQNMLALEAQKFAETEYTNEQLLRIAPDANQFRREMGEAWRGNKDVYGALKDPWLTFTMCLARAWMRAGNTKEYETLAGELLRGAGFEQYVEPSLFDSIQWTEQAKREDQPLATTEQRVSRAAFAYTNVVGAAALKDEANKLIRATAYNNLGYMEAWRGSYGNTEAFFRKAVDALNQAISLYPGDYFFNRNMLIVLKRLKRPDKELQPYLDKARAAGTGGYAQDFADVEKYVTGK